MGKFLKPLIIVSLEDDRQNFRRSSVHLGALSNIANLDWISDNMVFRLKSGYLIYPGLSKTWIAQDKLG